MSANAIQVVTEALRDRLTTAVKRWKPTGRVFVGPLDDADVKDADLILFLYRVVPNASLRNSAHTVPNGAAKPNVYLNSLPLDLYYLVTVGSLPNASEEPLLSALGFAMQDLQAVPTLTGAAFNGQAVHVALEPLTTEESSRVWNLFPRANYRTSVAYLITPVWIDPMQTEAIAPPVTLDELWAKTKELEVAA